MSELLAVPSRSMKQVSGNFDLELANAGDEVYLRDSIGTLIDSMSYGPSPTTSNVAIENRLLLNDAGGTWNGSCLERVWNSYSWARDGYGNAIKMSSGD